ncbi:MAG: hypothetical protein WD009_12130 [Phycisphaeraceae bacterium]
MVAVAGLMLLASGPAGPVGEAVGETFHWTAPAGGLFRDAANWDIGGDWPGSGDMAIFDLDAAYSVTLDGDVAHEGLNVHRGDVTLDLAGHDYELVWETLNPPNRVMVVGVDDGDDASMTLTGGGTLDARFGVIGYTAGARGQLRVAGTDAEGAPTSFNTSSLTVGAEGEGLLIVEDGAKLTTLGPLAIGGRRGGTGTMIVRGPGTTWDATYFLARVRIGFSDSGHDATGGHGALVIEAGAAVSVASLMEIGGGVDSTGALTVRGADTRLDTAQMALGTLVFGTPSSGSVGVVLIDDGAQVTSTWSQLGLFGGTEGTATVRGAGSRWVIERDSNTALYVGYGGDGVLNIEDGGEVVAHSAGIGALAGAGAVDVRGTGSRLRVISVLDIGRASTTPTAQGDLSVADGGRVGVGGPMEIRELGAVQIEPGGALAVGALPDGMTLADVAGGTVYLGPDATFTLLGGTIALDTLEMADGAALEYQAGTVALAGSRTIGSDATIAGFFGDAPVIAEDATLAIGGAGLIGTELEITGGVLESGDGVSVGDGAALYGEGTIRGLLENRGLIAPGRRGDASEGEAAATGTLHVDGTFEQKGDPGRTLRIALDGADHSALAVTGSATLAGLLELELLSNEPLDYWQPMGVLTASDITGAFEGFVAPNVQDAFFMLDHTDQAVTLTAGLTGDMNLDGVVDAVDVAPFVLALTDEAGYAAEHDVDAALVGDVNGDGVFDATDVAPFVELLVGGGASAVPEPGTLTLLVPAVLMLLRRRGLARRSGR